MERYHLWETMSSIQWVSLKDQEDDYLFYLTMRELGLTVSFAYFVLLSWPAPFSFGCLGRSTSLLAFFFRRFQDIIRISFSMRLGNSYNSTFFSSFGYSLMSLPVDSLILGLKLAGQTGQTSIQSSSMKTRSSPMFESPWFYRRILTFQDCSSLLKVFSISSLSQRNLMTFGSFGCSCSSSPILQRISPLNSLKILTFFNACISSSSCLDLSSWRQVSMTFTTTSKTPMMVVTTARQKQVMPMLIMVVWPQSLRLQRRMRTSMVMMQMSLMNLMTIFILLLQVRATTRQNWKARCRLLRMISRQIWMSPGKMLSRHSANSSLRQQLKTQQMQVTFCSMQLSCIRSSQISTLALFQRLEQMYSTIRKGKMMMTVETRMASPQIQIRLGRSSVTWICSKAQYMQGSSSCSRLSWMVMNLRMEIFLANLRVSLSGMCRSMKQMTQLMASSEKTEMKAVMMFLQKLSPLSQYLSLAGPTLSRSSGATFWMLCEYSQGKRLRMLRKRKQSMLQSRSLKTMGMVRARQRCASINCYSQKRMVTRLLQPPLKAMPMAMPRILRAERRAGGTELQQLMKLGMERVALFMDRERVRSLVSTVWGQRMQNCKLQGPPTHTSMSLSAMLIMQQELDCLARSKFMRMPLRYTQRLSERDIVSTTSEQLQVSRKLVTFCVYMQTTLKVRHACLHSEHTPFALLRPGRQRQLPLELAEALRQLSQVQAVQLFWSVSEGLSVELVLQRRQEEWQGRHAQGKVSQSWMQQRNCWSGQMEAEVLKKKISLLNLAGALGEKTQASFMEGLAPVMKLQSAKGWQLRKGAEMEQYCLKANSTFLELGVNANF